MFTLRQRWILCIGAILVVFIMTSPVSGVGSFGNGSSHVTSLPGNALLFPSRVARGGSIPAALEVTPSRAQLAPVRTIPVGSNPLDVAYDSAKGVVFVTNSGSNNVSVISDVSNSVVATIPVQSEPSGVAYDSGRGEIFVADSGSGNVSVINDTTYRVVANISVGSGPNGTVYDPVDGEVFVANYHSGSISVIADSSNTVVATVFPSGAPPAVLTYDASKGEVFSTGTAGWSPMTINVVSTRTNTVVSNISTGGDRVDPSLAYDPVTKEVYAGVHWWTCCTNYVATINDSTNTIGTYVYLGDNNGGSEAYGLAFDTSLDEVFVAENFGGDVSAFSDTSNQVTANYSVGANPRGLAYDAAKGEVFVADSGSNEVSVIFDGSIPVISSFTATPSQMLLGNSTNLTVTATGGRGNLSYAYTGLPAGCATSNTSLLSCTPTAAGTFTIRAFVNDSLGRGDTSTLTLTVIPSLKSGTVTPGSLDLAVGSGANLTDILACAGGGCPSGAAISWSESNSSLGTLNVTTGASVRFAANGTAGTEVLTVNATLDGKNATSRATIIIQATLQAVSLSPTTTSLPVGGNGDFTAAIACHGGPCPSGVTYSWSLTSTLATLNATKGASVKVTAGSVGGVVTLSVNATLNGITQRNTAQITLLPVLSSVTLSPTPSSLAAGASVNLVATPACSGGPCPSGMSYAWSISNGHAKLNSTSGDQVQLTAGSSSGTVALFLNVTLNGKTVSASPLIVSIKGSQSSSGFPLLLIAAIVAVAAVLAVALLLVVSRRKKSQGSEPASTTSATNGDSGKGMGTENGEGEQEPSPTPEKEA